MIRKRGRPLGSKGKPKVINEKAISLDIKEVKRQIRLLRKIKSDTHKGSDDRHDLCRKIRELRKQLIPIQAEVTPEKQALINQILQKRPEYTRLNMDLNKYTIEQLKKHSIYIQDKARLI